MSVIRQEDFIASVAGALQYISYYHPVDYITSLAKRLRARAIARRQGCHGADPHQQPHVRRGPSPHLPGHRHRQRFRQGRHGCPLRGRARREPSTCRKCATKAYAAPTSIPTTSFAPRCWPIPQARARTPRTTPPPSSTSNWSAATPSKSPSRPRAAARRPKQIRHAQSIRFRRRMGAEDRSYDGRGMVPARHARHRHRRHRRKSHAARQAVADGPHRHPGPDRPRPQNHRRKTSRRALRQSQSLSASARRDWAASPPCWT